MEGSSCCHTQRKDIAINPSDKGAAVVVRNKEPLYPGKPLATFRLQLLFKTLRLSYHLRQCDRARLGQLLHPRRGSTYESDHHARLRQQLGYIFCVPPPKNRQTHKSGRPIVSACSCPTVHISEFSEAVFQRMVIKLPSFIKDTNDVRSLFDSDFSKANLTTLLFLMCVLFILPSITLMV